MQLDYGRQQDLDELYEAYRAEKSQYFRIKIEQAIDAIMNESRQSKQLRNELIRAFRSGDKSSVEYCQIELRRLQADKYNNNMQL
jgi:uncharacterized protein YlaI